MGGKPNKGTLAAREAIGRLVDGNIHRMQSWLDLIAARDGPLAAWKCMTDVIEYHIPRLARAEITGEGGGPVRTVHEDLARALALPADERRALLLSLAKLGVDVGGPTMVEDAQVIERKP